MEAEETSRLEKIKAEEEVARVKAIEDARV